MRRLSKRPQATRNRPYTDHRRIFTAQYQRTTNPKNAFDSAWQRIMEKAVTAGLEIEGQQLKLEKGFKFHDLKAKGVSDHTEHHSGHKSEKARQIYIRKLQQIEATQ